MSLVKLFYPNENFIFVLPTTSKWVDMLQDATIIREFSLLTRHIVP